MLDFVHVLHERPVDFPERPVDFPVDFQSPPEHFGGADPQ